VTPNVDDPASLIGGAGEEHGLHRVVEQGSTETSEKREAQPGAVIRHRFQELHQEGRKLIQSWAERAAAQFDCAERDSFEPFIFGWIALNAGLAASRGGPG